MTEVLTILSDFIETFFQQPPRIAIVLGLVVFGYGLKRSVINDRWIPLILPVLGIILFPVALGTGPDSWGGLGVEGFVGGCLAVWINQCYRQLFANNEEGDSMISRLLSALRSKKSNENKTTISVPPGSVRVSDAYRPASGPCAPDNGVRSNSPESGV